MNLSFNKDTHTYTLDGHIIPNVTSVLSDLLPCWQANEWYLQRGKAVHACAAMIALGIEFNYDPQIEGQVKAIRKFWQEIRPQPVAIETKCASAKYGYACTPDLIAQVAGAKKENMVFEYKASFSVSLPYQMVAQSIAWSETNKTKEPRWGMGVEVHPDGNYKLSKKYDLRKYKAGWFALLGVYKIRLKYNMVKIGGKT
jgi:hypothetical protein